MQENAVLQRQIRFLFRVYRWSFLGAKIATALLHIAVNVFDYKFGIDLFSVASGPFWPHGLMASWPHGLKPILGVRLANCHRQETGCLLKLQQSGGKRLNWAAEVAELAKIV